MTAEPSDACAGRTESVSSTSNKSIAGVTLDLSDITAGMTESPKASCGDSGAKSSVDNSRLNGSKIHFSDASQSIGVDVHIGPSTPDEPNAFPREALAQYVDPLTGETLEIKMEAEGE